MSQHMIAVIVAGADHLKTNESVVWTILFICDSNHKYVSNYLLFMSNLVRSLKRQFYRKNPELTVAD